MVLPPMPAASMRANFPASGAGRGDCFFLPARDPTEAAQIVVDLVAERLPAHYGFQVGEVQVPRRCTRGRGSGP